MLVNLFRWSFDLQLRKSPFPALNYLYTLCGFYLFDFFLCILYAAFEKWRAGVKERANPMYLQGIDHSCCHAVQCAESLLLPLRLSLLLSEWFLWLVGGSCATCARLLYTLYPDLICELQILKSLTYVEQKRSRSSRGWL